LFAAGLAVSTTSKNQDFAFQVADYFSSEEAQQQLAKTGVVTPLKSDAVRSKLFEGHPSVKDLDLSVIYKLHNADPYAKTIWDKKALTIVQRYMQDFVSGKADMNTTIRKVDEEINKMVQENTK
jgi:ABC-type glycerol-3-phosphate transport system substrate-binding protein